MNSSSVHRLAAFTTDPSGGNPAGVWVGDELPDVATMQRIAAEVGFPETAFVAPATGFERTIRYYSPEVEVPFCGHATIATGVWLGETHGDGTYRFSTRVGEVPVVVAPGAGGQREAALTSVDPAQKPAAPGLVAAALTTLRWSAAELDPTIPPVLAFAGAWHLVLAVRTHERLDHLRYDFAALKELMQRENLTTLQLIWRESPHVFHARNPFPVGGVVEDPATGAAAAALGGYLRAAHLVTAPASLEIHQGAAMGRPSLVRVEIPTHGGIVVRGTAVRM